jgi:hypothetical protein
LCTTMACCAWPNILRACVKTPESCTPKNIWKMLYVGHVICCWEVNTKRPNGTVLRKCISKCTSLNPCCVKKKKKNRMNIYEHCILWRPLLYVVWAYRLSYDEVVFQKPTAPIWISRKVWNIFNGYT